MAAKERALWRMAAALLLLLTVPAYAVLPPLPPAPSSARYVSDEQLNPRATEDLFLLIVVACRTLPAPTAVGAGPKTRVRAFDQSAAEQRQASLGFGREIAACRCVQAYAFTLGPAGNRTRIEEADGTSRSYGYDALYRLTSETVAGVGGVAVYGKTFGYDPVGNRLRQVHTDAAGTVTTTNYGYDDRDRLLSEGAQGWEWDANGNLTAKLEEATYAWDLDDRLQQVTLGEGTVVTHTYDADGVRVRTETLKADGTATVVNYLVDTSAPLSQVVAETTSVGGGPSTLSAYYVRGDDLLAVMRPADGGTWASRFYHADGLGSIRALTDESGTVTDRYAFTAFGELLDHSGDDAQAYLFAGEQLDPNSGFYYNRARWMDPGVGRFASTDPFAGLIGEPVSLHRYLYANADPVGLVDPTGRSPLIDLKAAMAVFTTIGSKVAAVAYTIYLTGLNALYMSPIYLAKLAVFGAWVSAIGLALQGGAFLAEEVALWQERSSRAWVTNSQPIPPTDSFARGQMLEDLADPNLGGKFPRVDDIREGHATSLKTHGLNPADGNLSRAYRNAIRSDLSAMYGIENRDLAGPDRTGQWRVVPAGSINTKSLQVGVPENHFVRIIRDPTFRAWMREYSQRYRAFVRVVPVRGWRM